MDFVDCLHWLACWLMLFWLVVLQCVVGLFVELFQYFVVLLFSCSRVSLLGGLLAYVVGLLAFCVGLLAGLVAFCLCVAGWIAWFV